MIWVPPLFLETPIYHGNGKWLYFWNVTILSGQISSWRHTTDFPHKVAIWKGNGTPYFKEIQVGEILFHLARCLTKALLKMTFLFPRWEYVGSLQGTWIHIQFYWRYTHFWQNHDEDGRRKWGQSKGETFQLHVGELDWSLTENNWKIDVFSGSW